PKTFSYAVSVARDGSATSERGGASIPADGAWAPEHLVLAGLARCTLTSLRYHAKRDGIAVTGGADAAGGVGPRGTDRRFALLRVKVAPAVPFEPPPSSVRELVAKAERDCFVGASLTAKPRYRWTVNGEELA